MGMLGLTFITFKLDEEARDDIPNTRADVHEWPLFAERQARGDRERKSDTLGQERPTPKVPVDHEAGEDGLDLGYTAAGGIVHDFSGWLGLDLQFLQWRQHVAVEQGLSFGWFGQGCVMLCLGRGDQEL